MKGMNLIVRETKRVGVTIELRSSVPPPSHCLSVCCALTAPAPDDILTIARKMADIDN